MALSREKPQAWITVEVAYGTGERQRIIELRVAEGTTALEAARQSGITRDFPQIKLEADAMGIFSRLLDGKHLPAPADYVLQPRDRVEIYRPLLIDPKSARIDRAEKSGATRKKSARNRKKST